MYEKHRLAFILVVKLFLCAELRLNAKHIVVSLEIDCKNKLHKFGTSGSTTSRQGNSLFTNICSFICLIIYLES